MPIFQITVKNSINSNGVRLDKGASVQVSTNSYSNPLTDYNGKQQIVNAFYRMYGVDLSNINVVNTAWMECEQR